MYYTQSKVQILKREMSALNRTVVRVIYDFSSNRNAGVISPTTYAYNDSTISKTTSHWNQPLTATSPRDVNKISRDRRRTKVQPLYLFKMRSRERGRI